jgi:hypothetical protein
MIKTFILILLSLFAEFIYAQYYRLTAIGGMYIAVEDVDNELNLYDFGENPAWIIYDENQNKIWMHSDFSKSKGEYKRIYDPYQLNLYGISFFRVQTLDKSGTFKGWASYTNEIREKLYGSLLLFPYDGKSFFVTDTTTGNFRYQIITFGFDYGSKVFKYACAGVNVNYKIIDGLKDIYTNARDIYRQISISPSLAIPITQNLNIGFKLTISNWQEQIEAKSENLYDAELYLYRGNSYAIKRTSNIVNLKLKEKNNEIGIQTTYSPQNNLNLGIKFNIKRSGQYILIPYGLLEEYEFGYANFNASNINLLSRLKLNKKSTIGLAFKYEYLDIWSKHSPRNLLLWREKIKNFESGLGIWSNLSELFSAGIEISYKNSTADSMKYIDNIFKFIKSDNYIIKLGGEFKSKKITLRAGFNYLFSTKDITFGGDNVAYSSLSFGITYDPFADLILVLGKINAKIEQKNNSVKRNIFKLILILKF